MQLPTYVTLLARWDELVGAATQPGAHAWPFERSKRAAWSAFADIFNRTDPAGLPASLYGWPRTPANGAKFTMDESNTQLGKFERRVFGEGPYAQMSPMCRPLGGGGE